MEMGSKMKITVRNPLYPIRDRYFFDIPEFREYEGVETTLKHIDSLQYLCLTTGIKDFPVRVIDRTMIVNSEKQPLFALDEFFGVTERLKVEGSKGAVYELTKTNGKWACTCPGFEYRKDCKHVRNAGT
jgi:hypothetical protein